MTKIEKLTKKQKKQLKEFHKEWFDIGCSCEPADKERGEKAIATMYSRIGKPAPKFVWTQSPATAIMVIAALKEKSDLRDSLKASLWGSLKASIWGSLGGSLNINEGLFISLCFDAQF